MPEEKMLIGELSKKTGFSIQAIRFYESKDIIESTRGENGYRYFSARELYILKLVKHYKRLGFSLNEISKLMVFQSDAEKYQQEAQSLIESRLHDISAEIVSLKLSRALLAEELSEALLFKKANL